MKENFFFISGQEGSSNRYGYGLSPSFGKLDDPFIGDSTILEISAIPNEFKIKLSSDYPYEGIIIYINGTPFRAHGTSEAGVYIGEMSPYDIIVKASFTKEPIHVMEMRLLSYPKEITDTIKRKK